MELPTLLHSLTVEGFALSMAGCNTLEVRGPTARLTPELRAALADHKPTLLAMLTPLPEADALALEERPAIQGEAAAPEGAEAWPDAFTLPNATLATHLDSEGDTTPDAPTDWWTLLSPSQWRELAEGPTPGRRCGWCGGIAHHHRECFGQPRMPWGKHKGLRLAEVSERYLSFILRQGIGRGDDRRAFLGELKRRNRRFTEGEWRTLEESLSLEEMKRDARQQNRYHQQGEAAAGCHPDATSDRNL